MQKRMVPVSFTLPPEVVTELQRAAHQQSLDSGHRVTASSIVRQLVEGYLRDPIWAASGDLVAESLHARQHDPQ